MLFFDTTLEIRSYNRRYNFNVFQFFLFAQIIHSLCTKYKVAHKLHTKSRSYPHNKNRKITKINI